MSDVRKIVGDWAFMGKIGARPSTAPFTPIQIPIIAKITEQLRSGEAISIDKLPEYLKDGQPFLDKQSLPFVLYISSVSQHRSELPKFHFKYCRTLEEMEEKGAFACYRAKYDICNPVFKINDGENNANLKVCLNCCNDFRSEAAYRFFNATKSTIEDKFDMPKFFAEFGVIDLPTSTHSGGQDGYTRDWKKIADQEKERVSWQCQDPNHIGENDFRNNKKDLHGHHRDGVKSRNVSDNVEVLCNVCHAKRHPHMQ